MPSAIITTAAKIMCAHGGQVTLIPKQMKVLAGVSRSCASAIVHRDLKPETALITKGGRVKVADFGIAKAALSGQKGLTSEGMTVGTPEYMSPEQAMAKDVSTASDLYAIGCMTYEMLAGRLPIHEGSQPRCSYEAGHRAGTRRPRGRSADP